METAPHISVVICTRNRATLLGDACNSLLGADDAGRSWELIIVDNMSTDRTREIAAELAADQPEVIRVVAEQRLGLQFARNTGVREARGEIVAFLDDDALCDPGWLRAVVGAFDDPDVQCAGGPVRLVYDGPSPDWFEPRYFPYLSAWDLGFARRPVYYSEYPRGVNMAFRREVFDRVGRFSSRLDRRPGSLRSCGETELCLRIERSGGLIVYVPDAAVLHRVSGARLTARWMIARFFGQGASEAILEWRHWGWRGLRVGCRRSVRNVRRVAGHRAGLYGLCQLAVLGGYLQGVGVALASVPRYRPRVADVALPAVGTLLEGGWRPDRSRPARDSMAGQESQLSRNDPSVEAGPPVIREGNSPGPVRSGAVRFMTGVDCGYYLEATGYGCRWRAGGEAVDPVSLLAAHGVDWIRVRLFTPKDGRDGLVYAGRTAQLAEAAGLRPFFNMFLTAEWATAEGQPAPPGWGELPIEARAQAVRAYAESAARYLTGLGVRVDLVQVGNEIDYGLCGAYDADESVREEEWRIRPTWEHSALLVAAAMEGIRSVAPDVRFIGHIAHWFHPEFGIAFYRTMRELGVQYDFVGASYYPTSGIPEHYFGVSNRFCDVQDYVDPVTEATGLPLVFCEYAYPSRNRFGGKWGDRGWYLPVAGYELDPEGQRQWLSDFLSWCRGHDRIAGAFYFSPEFYWSEEWEAFALFDSSGVAKPAVVAFAETESRPARALAPRTGVGP